MAVAEVTLASYRPYSQPYQVEVIQREFHHDQAILSIYEDDIDSRRYQAGSPVMIRYGQPPKGMQTFYGFINDPRVHFQPAATTRESKHSSKIHCVGASFPLKMQDQRSWSHHTAPQAAAAIASAFRLSSQIQTHTKVWDSLMMGGQSYWQFLVEIAQKIGFTVYCSGVELHFHARNTDPTNLPLYVPFIDVHTPSTIDFHVVAGSEAPEGGRLAYREYSGIDVKTGHIFTLSDSGQQGSRPLGRQAVMPIFNEYQQGLVAASWEEGLAKLSGAATANQLFVSATARIVGTVSITQGMLVYVSNAPSNQSGLWYVISAVHTINNRGTYTTDLVLGRESLGPTRAYAFNREPKVVSQARFVNSQWMAA